MKNTTGRFTVVSDKELVEIEGGIWAAIGRRVLRLLWADVILELFTSSTIEVTNTEISGKRHS